VEHSLAALAGLQIDNVLMEIYGSEVPILDGSAIEFVKGFKAVGIEEQKANREFYVIDEPVHYNDPVKQIDIAAFPFDGYRITVMVDYNSNVLGIQHATLVQIENFETEFASSRTFCFFHELEGLLQAGLIKGGDLNNAIVIVDKVPSQEQLEQLAKLFNKKDVQVKEGYLNNIELRHKNEPARHKLLDMVGDLSLLGNPIKAQILAARPGHAANIAFAKNLKKLIKQKKLIKKYQKNASQNVVFDINAIQKILPHRYPFLLVDKIIEFRENYIVGVKNVTINEPFFVGHFEGNPIMPGVLQLEAMAQVGGVLLLNSVENPNDVWVYFLAIDNARFRKPVVPGDQLVFKLELIALKRGICKMSGKAFVNDVLVSEADLTASLVPKKKNESE
jgi:UDP-3-O-[3-hydroxymyristoyl] N-acetylglucosamine deacetylase/3-hydroxyacyl-[acyl-carrier-protein] dehydratase